MKTYEEYIYNRNSKQFVNILEQYKFKIGDYVRLKRNNEIYKVYIIDPEDDRQTYEIEHAFIDDDSEDVILWVAENEIELVEDYEIDAIKYNIG